MPSTLLGNPYLSGGQLIVSGNPWSGQIRPVGGIQLFLATNSSGNAYITLSGGVRPASGGPTINSGGFFLSGGGLMDGMPLGPGASYFIPRIGTGPSGVINIYANCDQACSGQARLYYEVF
jgi:hypothetical protein